MSDPVYTNQAEEEQVEAFDTSDKERYNCGVYEISTRYGKYIGSSKNLTKRKSTHLRELKYNSHYNYKLQRAYNKEFYAVFKVLLVCIPEDLHFYEQLCIDGLKPEFNLASRVDRPHLNKKLSQETKNKISLSLKGRKQSLETRQKLSILHTGKRMSDEARMKMSLSKKGFRHSELSKAKIGIASSLRRGFKHSAKTKKTLSDIAKLIWKRRRNG